METSNGEREGRLGRKEQIQERIAKTKSHLKRHIEI